MARSRINSKKESQMNVREIEVFVLLYHGSPNSCQSLVDTIVATPMIRLTSQKYDILTFVYRMIKFDDGNVCTGVHLHFRLALLPNLETAVCLTNEFVAQTVHRGRLYPSLSEVGWIRMYLSSTID